MTRSVPPLLFLFLLTALNISAQGTRTLSPAALAQSRVGYAPLPHPVDEQIPLAKAVRPAGVNEAPGKTNTLVATELGSASNIFNWVRNQENLLYCNDSLGVLVHLHRQDVTIWGGGSSESGKLRYDISTDGGATFALDIGELNPLYTKTARYCQVIGYDPGGSAAAADLKLVWGAAALNTTPDWEGVVTGVSGVVTGGTPSSTETYALGAYIPSSLCHGLPGEFWYTDMEYSASALGSNIYIHKGVYNAGSGDVDWIRKDTLTAPYDLSFDGTPHSTFAMIEFSPDGTDGWVTILGDMRGDTVISPIYWHSTDGGDTWSAPGSVDLSSFSWYKDTLQTLWLDSLGNPAGSGKATTAYDFDITVDGDGNLHIGTVIGNASSTATPLAGYSFHSNLAKFMTDIYTTDGGVTWNSMYLAPVLTFRNIMIGSLIVMDNFPQAARNTDGSKVFFTWADTDTCTAGFGVSENIYPNLRGVGWRISDGFRTMYKLFTDPSTCCDGNILFPHMAPQTLRAGTRDKLFTGFVGYQVPNDELQPCSFYTMVNDTWFDDSEYADPASFTDLSWNAVCGPLRSGDSYVIAPFRCYPNPATNEVNITFELAAGADVSITLTNPQGQQVAVMPGESYARGRHEVALNTSMLPAGIYFCSLRTGNKMITQKLIVAR